jgi:cell division inhibitor SulA
MSHQVTNTSCIFDMRATCLRLVSLVHRSQVPAALQPTQYTNNPTERQSLLDFIQSKEDIPLNVRLIRAPISRRSSSSRWENVYDTQKQLHKEALRKLKKRLGCCTFVTGDLPE